jgi:hypothetical protein
LGRAKASLPLDEAARLRVVRKMYALLPTLDKLKAENAGLKKAEQASKRSEKAPADSVVHIVGEPADMNALDTPKPTVKAKPAPKRT